VVTIQFTTPNDGGSPITGYLVSIDEGPFETLSSYTRGEPEPNEATFRTGESCESLYVTYALEAVNVHGHSAPGNTYAVSESEEEC
jgi:hypothetical protein